MTHDDLEKIMSTMAAASAAAGHAAPTDVSAAHEQYLALRDKLGALWSEKILSKVEQEGCTSVGLVPASRQDLQTRDSALLMVVDSSRYLKKALPAEPVNLYTLWSYANQHNYGLELYIHNSTLPANVPAYFVKLWGIKKLFSMGYTNVLGIDWDVYISPHTAPPLSLFLSEYPQAGLLMQGELNICAGTMLWRNNDKAHAILDQWWQLALTGCCTRGFHDQMALKHILYEYLRNYTGDASIYTEHSRAELGHSREPVPVSARKWLTHKAVLQKGSAVGFVSVELNFNSVMSTGLHYNRIALASCQGFWWGCIKWDSPALLYHTGHGRVVPWLSQRKLEYALRWAGMAQQTE